MKIILCLIIDAIGMGTYAIPILGETGDIAWAPIQLILVKLVTGKYSKLTFFEEILPFTDVIPSATIKYLSLKDK